MNLMDRLRYGPLQDEGDWEDAAREYRNRIYPEDDVDVTIEHFYAPPAGPGRGASKLDEESEEGVLGREALEAVDSYIEDEITFDIDPDEILMEYEHRSRGDDDVLTVEGGYNFMFHRNMYRVRFEF